MEESRFKAYITKSPFFSMALFSASAFVLGIFLCWLGYQYQLIFVPTPNKVLRLNQTNYPLIDPLLLCNTDPKDFNRDKRLEATISDFIDSRINNQQVENMSVYLIDYGSGKWAGVNENERYDPASMLKVPIMIAYYKIAETNPGILDQKTSFNGDDQNVGEYFKSKNIIKAGKIYTIEELIQGMIENSDNTASVLLENYINKNSLYDVYTDLGLPVPADAPNVEYLSAKLYAFFLRILYNGTYLDKKYSEIALEHMTHSDIQGIRSGVPENVVVAQKFGERSIYDTMGQLKDRELHDCGIIYKKDNPYLLCIMSRGKDFDQLAKNISDLSKLVYKNIGK